MPGCGLTTHGAHSVVTAREIGDQRRYEREILDIADREKQRMGRELHDGLCQSLAGIGALSSTLARRLAGAGHDELQACAAEINRLLQQTIADARDMARGLGAAIVSNNGLDGAIDVLAGNVRHMFQVPCSFESDRPFPRIDPEAETHVFRIAQESVNNAVVHGRPGRIEISLRRTHDVGLLSIRDDGVGLPDDTHVRDGFGLQSMAYRARRIGASIEVRRRRIDGTAVNCTFPLSKRLTNEIHRHKHKQHPGGGRSYEEDPYR